MSDYRVRPDCRLCGAGDLETVLELKPTPPANEFVGHDAPEQEKFPLYLARCRSCGHVQLPVVVDPERLFRSYVYVSGTSPSFVDHFARYAEECLRGDGLDKPRWLNAGDLVVDIGSNDGTLLSMFKAVGMTVQGIDPAKEIAARATAGGIDTWPEFFTRETAQKIAWAHGKKAALVVANNVFAHADDLRAIALGVRDLLALGGHFVFEVQYVVDLVEKSLFDMIYHEHLSYHSLGPLVPFFDSIGMSLVDARGVDTHGGSIRCTAVVGRDQHQSDRFKSLLRAEVERFQYKSHLWENLRRRIDKSREELRSFLDSEHAMGRLVAGYGAPAKLTTLCHEFGITTRDIAFIVDDSPLKQNLFTPGTRIRVTSGGILSQDPPDSVVLFAWNFAEPIAKKLRESGFTGKLVVPLPEFRVIA